MDKAKEIYSVGKEKLVNAEEIKNNYNISVSYKSHLFICPCCGEYVGYVRRDKNKSFFRHANENEYTKLCELKSKFNSQFSIYERTGLPLYLKKIRDKLYELYIGFHGIEEEKYNALIKEKGYILVKSCKENSKEYFKYNFNENNFENKTTVLKKIDIISSKYSIYYSTERMRRILTNIWGSEIEGIQSNEALFSFGEKGGKRIRINEEITTDEEYLYLGQSDRLFNYYSGVRSDFLGNLSCNMNYNIISYKVYKITFSVNEENEFKRLAELLRNRLKVSLVYKPLKIITMWPPSVLSKEGIKYVNNKEEALCLLENSQENSSLYLHYSSDVDKILGKELYANKFLMKIPIKKYKIPITINEKYDSISFFYNGYVDTIKQYKNHIRLLDQDKNNIDIGKKIQLPKNKMVIVNSLSKCNIIHVKRNNNCLVYRIKNNREIAIENVEFEDRIIIAEALKENVLLEYFKDKALTNKSFDDEKIYGILSKLNMPYVECPVWIKNALYSIKEFPKTYFLVRSYVIHNRIPIKALIFLKQFYTER